MRTSPSESDFAPRLLKFYDQSRRDLPWRHVDGDPWAIWVSEVMLQQTRVETVLDTWQRFIARYPKPADWAIVDDDELQRAWRGLGYYRRARLLRDGAQQVLDRHGGEVPDDPKALGALSGIGEYTRGAIASIAFDHPELAIDGNVERVFARRHAIREDIKQAATRRKLKTLVTAAQDHSRPGDFNQALMDLGATVCIPRSPRCDDCPVRDGCKAFDLGLTDQLPVLPPKAKPIPVQARAVLILGRGHTALAHRIPVGEVNQGQLELLSPGILIDHPDAGTELATTLQTRFGGRFEVEDPLCTVRHGITNHRIALTVHRARLLGRRPRGIVAVGIDDPEAPWSTPSRKALQRIDWSLIDRSRRLRDSTA